MQGVNLAIRNPHVSSSADEIKEEPDYVNVAVSAQNNIPATPRDKSRSFIRSFAPLAACWLILLMIIILRIYFTSVISENNTKLTAENQRLTKVNQEVETEMNNLTEQMETMVTTWTELNVSRAQWSIDAYCPKPELRVSRALGRNGGHDGKPCTVVSVTTCKPCEEGWTLGQFSCYKCSNAEPSFQLRWEDARKECRGNISDLTVVADEKEKEFVESISVPGAEKNEYWIGLKAVEGKWKWINGSNMTNNDWISPPANDSLCVVSVQTQGWKSVSCEEKNAWICEKKALSV